MWTFFLPSSCFTGNYWHHLLCARISRRPLKAICLCSTVSKYKWSPGYVLILRNISEGWLDSSCNYVPQKFALPRPKFPTLILLNSMSEGVLKSWTFSKLNIVPQKLTPPRPKFSTPILFNSMSEQGVLKSLNLVQIEHCASKARPLDPNFQPPSSLTVWVRVWVLKSWTPSKLLNYEGMYVPLQFSVVWLWGILGRWP